MSDLRVGKEHQVALRNHPTLRSLLIVGATLGAYLGVTLAVSRLTGDPLLAAAVSAGAVTAFALVYRSQWLERRAGVQVTPLVREWFPLVAGVALAAAWLLGQTLYLMVLAAGGTGAPAGAGNMTSTQLGLYALTALILAPIGEEVLFRGVVFSTLRQAWPLVPSVLVSTALFAVMHGNVGQLVMVLPLGVVLALMVEFTGRVWPAVLGHIGFNMAAPLIPNEIEAALLHPWLALPYAVGFAAVAWLLLRWVRVRSPRSTVVSAA